MGVNKIDIHKILEQLQYNPKDPLLFNSGFFLWFFLAFLFFYQFLYKKKIARVFYFTLFSLYFFYKASGWYFLLIILSALVDFNLSNWIYSETNATKKKLILIFSIVINLGMLAWFKYTDLFIDIYNDAADGNISPLKLILPVGISFYTFENLSYTIDVYRGHFKPVKSFLDYCFFLSFFPKLVMGPIVRASDFIPQIRQDIVISNEDVGKGLFLILGGLFKKVVISDYIYANFVEYIFDNPAQHSGIECLFGVYGYALVIYCDFSGYSDMAIGMAKWMGFSIPKNFDLPYQSSNITEFWRRWHISLSSWLRDYLYIPLGGNRKGKIRQYANLLVTMLLGGLWHGASLKFVLWGGLHGAGLAIDKMIFQKIRNKISGKWIAQPMKVVGILLTFHFVCFCWIFFKAHSFDDAIIMIKQIVFNFNLPALSPLLMGYASVFWVMWLAYVLHITPKHIYERLEALCVRSNMVFRIVFILFFIWLIIQVKQAYQVTPVYLQF